MVEEWIDYEFCDQMKKSVIGGSKKYGSTNLKLGISAVSVRQTTRSPKWWRRSRLELRLFVKNILIAKTKNHLKEKRFEPIKPRNRRK